MQYVYWGSMVEERDGGLEGTRNWRRSAVWLGCVCGRTGLLFGGDAELAHSAIPLGVFVSLWVE